jgi:hypothetical protein
MDVNLRMRHIASHASRDLLAIDRGNENTVLTSFDVTNSISPVSVFRTVSVMRAGQSVKSKFLTLRFFLFGSFDGLGTRRIER